MKRLFFQLNVAVLMLLSFSFYCKGADKYVLEYKLEKGKTYKQLTAISMNMAMEAMGQKMNMDMKMETGIHFDVIEKNNNVYDIRMSYQKIKMEMSAPAPVSIDSDSPENATDKNMGKVFKSLIGIPIDIQLTQQGKVASVKGVDKLTEQLSKLNEQSRQMFGQQFSEKMIQTSIEATSNYFPGKPVAVGESWNVALTVNSSGFDLISKMTLTLKEVKNNIATLECTGTLETPEGGAVLNIQGMDASVSVSGEQSGTILMDTKTGWIVRSEITQKSKQDIEVMGQSMPQEIETKVIVTAD